MAKYEGTEQEKRLQKTITRAESRRDRPKRSGPNVPAEKQAIVAFIVSLAQVVSAPAPPRCFLENRLTTA